MTIEIPDITAAYVQEYREVEAELQIYTNEYLLKCSRQEQIRYNNLWYRRDYIRSYIFDMILSPIQKSASNAPKYNSKHSKGNSIARRYVVGV